jgi:2-hydroxy-4-carboxymuconate semialdehyde hemiacetal dehydrogenase
MVGHTRRFNPSHQYVHNKITAGEFNIQQMDVQTYFFRRTNMNALGQGAQLDRPPAVAPRGSIRSTCSRTRPAARSCRRNAVQGPIHPEPRHRDGTCRSS